MTDEEKEAIKTFKEFIDNGYCGDTNIGYLNAPFSTILNLINKQQKEIEKKDKIINEMVKEMCKLNEKNEEDCFVPRNYSDIDDCIKNKCKNCIKQYFEKKVDEENEN